MTQRNYAVAPRTYAERRLALGLTQLEMAERVGCHLRTIQLIEAGDGPDFSIKRGQLDRALRELERDAA